MNTRFYNAWILTPSGGVQGELWVQGSRIAYIGPRKDAAVSWDRQIDAEGNLLIPGFKDAHTHSAMTFLRSYADDLPLHDWLERQVFPMEAKLTGEDIYHLTRLAILEYLTSGITANFDMYFHPAEIARAAVDCGFRTVMCDPLSQFNGSLEALEDRFQRYNAYHELIGYRLGFHGEYTSSEAQLEGVAALSQQYQAPVYTHHSETRDEVEGCIARHGMTPTAYLDSLGLFRYGGGLFHCVHMTPADLELLRDRGLWVVTNPASNCKLASGIAPLQQMTALGIPLAIGTDGPASNNCLDMFREMFLATALQKIANNDASAMDAELVLQMAVSGGALAMGLPDCDCLAEGKLADLVLIDLHQPNMQPINHITKNIVYSGSKQNVKLTMINGCIRYENGRFFVNADPEEIYAKANEIIRQKKA